jgi:hypothetical protein
MSMKKEKKNKKFQKKFVERNTNDRSYAYHEVPELIRPPIHCH